MGDKKKPLKIKDKESNRIHKDEIKKNKPTHIKFNYSFLTSNNSLCYNNTNFVEGHKLQLLQRVIELSDKELIHILAYKKNIGLEFIEKKDFILDVKYNQKFDDVEYRKKESNGKYAVFRLYTNNKPLPSRIVGKMINNVFYIMYIDLNHELYKG